MSISINLFCEVALQLTSHLNESHITNSDKSSDWVWARFGFLQNVSFLNLSLDSHLQMTPELLYTTKLWNQTRLDCPKYKKRLAQSPPYFYFVYLSSPWIASVCQTSPIALLLTNWFLMGLLMIFTWKIECNTEMCLFLLHFLSVLCRWFEACVPLSQLSC